MSTVLVTGGSGFIGSHCLLKLLQQGHTVRTTVRSLRREAEVRALVGGGGDKLSFFEADLEKDPGWREATQGCDYVLHVASPFPMNAPANEDDLIRPAREGALRVLRAARDSGVKRVVLTSSFAAIGYGLDNYDRVLDETVWSNPNSPDIGAYHKSKTLAEKAAWDFIKAEGGALELSVINPVGVFGPVLGKDISTSVEIVRRALTGGLPAVPKASFGVVDVRDVVDLHIAAMTHPGAKGERFLCVTGEFVGFGQIAAILGKHPPTLPDWVVRLGALFARDLRPLVPELGKTKRASNAKARKVFDWTPRTVEEAILSSAKSLRELGMA